MERALAGAGADAAPQDADTPAEVLRRGIDGCGLPPGPAHTLLGLFREARFSRHPMTPADRAAADDALAALLAAVETTAGAR